MGDPMSAGDVQSEVEQRPSCGGHLDAGGEARHAVAEPREWPWFPTHGHGHLARHPYCRACGKVAALGGDRALNAGGIANLLARLDARFRQHGIKLTEAHKRLVMRRLHAAAVDDPFGQSRENQLDHVAHIVATHVGIPPETVGTYLRSC